jgi:type VI protein secretion system component VasF
MKTASNNPPNAPDPLAVALSKLDPAPHGLEWNALMFAAGRESKARALTFWKAVAIICALLACTFAFLYFSR